MKFLKYFTMFLALSCFVLAYAYASAGENGMTIYYLVLAVINTHSTYRLVQNGF